MESPGLRKTSDMRTLGADKPISGPRKAARTLILVLVGGYSFQLAGCTAGVVPVVLSLAESTLLSRLFGGFLP